MSEWLTQYAHFQELIIFQLKILLLAVWNLAVAAGGPLATQLIVPWSHGLVMANDLKGLANAFVFASSNFGNMY